MKRVKISSRTTTTRVQLNYPTVDANKRYRLTVEKLDVPAMDSLIVNKTLFTVERRLIAGAGYGLPYAGNYGLPVSQDTFTAKNVKTVSQLIYQLNSFFLDLCRRTVTHATELPYDAALHQYALLGTPFVRQANRDWYSGDLANTDAIEGGLHATIRSDGKIGIRFSAEAAKFFVIRLTDDGMHLFGHERRYVAVNAAGQFNTGVEYIETGDPEVISNCPLPLQAALTLAGGYEVIFNKSVFSHLSYRNELVLDCSLPLNNTVECDGMKSHYKRQLASYRFPSTEPSIRYDTNGRHLEETGVTKYVFETSRHTHNSFILKGSELQLFNLYLITRNYEYKDGEYIQRDTPYPLTEDAYYTVQLSILQVS